MYDIVIIGGGPAGLSAALYAARGGMKTLVVEKLAMGGQVMKTNEIDNYPGFFENPTGEELSNALHTHAQKFGVTFANEAVKSIENTEFDIKVIRTRRHTYMTKAIIFATGANPRTLGAEGEAELRGSGISYCATCDGAFFKDRIVAVIGGGNTAFEDAIYLSKLCRQVYIINRSKKFRAAATLVENAKRTENIQIITDTVCERFLGEGMLYGLNLKNVISGETSQLKADGAIVAIGVTPDSALAQSCGVELCPQGFIKTDIYMNTNFKGIFAAGDVRTTPLRQVITAAADGAVAAVSAVNYVNELGIKSV